jgi:hypothetical protein
MNSLADIVICVDYHVADFNYGSYIWRVLGATTNNAGIFNFVSDSPRPGEQTYAGQPIQRIRSFECFVRCPFGGLVIDGMRQMILRPNRDEWEEHLRTSPVPERVPAVVFGDIVRYIQKIGEPGPYSQRGLAALFTGLFKTSPVPDPAPLRGTVPNLKACVTSCEMRSFWLQIGTTISSAGQQPCGESFEVERT